MSPLQIRDTVRDDWDGPVVEILDEDTVVALVYWDEEVVVDVYPSAGEDSQTFDVPDLVRVLELAARVVVPDDVPFDEPSDIDPLDILSSEFDATAAVRGAEDEGFYPLRAAVRLVGRCEQLDLAVVSMEGFARREGLQRVPGQMTDLGDAHRGEPWETFRAGCNVQAHATLERWAAAGVDTLVAFEVQDSAGEIYVL